MSEHIEALVLKTIPHSDKHDIVSLYSQKRGRFSVIAPAPGGRRRRPVPLTVIEAAIDFSTGGFMHKMRSFTPLNSFSGISASPLKSASALFIADFLDRLLCEALPEPSLWDHIVASLTAFSNMGREAADFNILFTLSLLGYSGIMPDLSGYAPGKVFDLRAGCYSSILPAHSDYLQGEEAKLPLILIRLTPRTSPLMRLSGKQRGAIVAGILRYYSIHLPSMSKVNAHNILSLLF